MSFQTNLVADLPCRSHDNTVIFDENIYLLNSGREITAGGSQVKVTGQLNFCSDIPNLEFWSVKLFSLKQNLVKYKCEYFPAIKHYKKPSPSHKTACTALKAWL